MTTVTFVFLTLFSWMVSSGTWLSLDQCTDLSQYDEETKGFSSSASYKNTVIHDKAKTCESTAEMSVAVKGIFTKCIITKDCSLFPDVTVNCINGCMNPLQRQKDTVNREKQREHVCKCTIAQSLLYYLSKSSCLLLTIEIKTDNHNNPSNHSTTSASHCSCIITLVLVDHWKTSDCVCFCKPCNLEVKFLQVFPFRESCRPTVPDIFILSERQVSLKSSQESKTYVRVCCAQILLKFYGTNCQKEAFLTQTGDIIYTTYTGRVESVWITLTSRWVRRCLLAAVLLLGIYMTITKMTPNRVSAARGSNATLVILFTMTVHSFSPSFAFHQSPAWSHIAVEISFVICLSCALGSALHMLFAGRTAHTVITFFCPTQQKFRALPVSVLLFWLTFSPSIPKKNLKSWFENILGECSMGSTLKLWTVLGQIEVLATLYCIFVSLPNLLQSIVTKLNFLSVLLHVQLVTCLHNSRVPIKYVVVIKINRLM